MGRRAKDGPEVPGWGEEESGMRDKAGIRKSKKQFPGRDLEEFGLVRSVFSDPARWVFPAAAKRKGSGS